MIRAIIDTNVLMSGIFWSGAPQKILEAWQQKKLKMVISPSILDEYARVGDILAKKYLGVDVAPILELITIHSELFLPQSLPAPVSRDPDDDKFIALAIAANCKIIISGDKDLLVVRRYDGVEIIKPGDFVKQYLRHSQLTP